MQPASSRTRCISGPDIAKPRRWTTRRDGGAHPVDGVEDRVWNQRLHVPGRARCSRQCWTRQMRRGTSEDKVAETREEEGVPGGGLDSEGDEAEHDDGHDQEREPRAVRTHSPRQHRTPLVSTALHSSAPHSPRQHRTAAREAGAGCRCDLLATLVAHKRTGCRVVKRPSERSAFNLAGLRAHTARQTRTAHGQRRGRGEGGDCESERGREVAASRRLIRR